MIGNDIVDITEAKLKSNWQRPRFLDKLFTEKEQYIILNSVDSFLMVWKLWSMKEAAYKLYTQLHPSRFYNPKAFECTVEENLGRVTFQNFRCFVKTKTTSSFIMSEASFEDVEMTSISMVFNHFDVKKHSEILKSEILTLISNMYDIQKQSLSFHKNEIGVPTVHFNSKCINVSLAHHGNYGAFAIST
ncbi:4'-phosphopantetheinyl transferase superfamily protein [Winogradskyella sp. R77965]|uniref:4'-phosphopantetheinyl transferase superfamily protein n=1 Tax=Winogradskyella sp. R77965 TaxID=3093872 RepID=UPI0037DCE5BB